MAANKEWKNECKTVMMMMMMFINKVIYTHFLLYNYIHSHIYMLLILKH